MVSANSFFSLLFSSSSVFSCLASDTVDRRWITYLIYIWTGEGWLYVAAAIDLFSRRVVGGSMSATMTAELVTDGLVTAILAAR